MKVKDIIYYYEIKIDFSKNKVTQQRREYIALGVNDAKLVINDDHFTSIKHKKSYRGDSDTLFNEIRVYESNYAPHWDHISAYLHTSSSNKKIAYKRMKKELEKYIYGKHGRYCNAIMLFLDKIEI